MQGLVSEVARSGSQSMPQLPTLKSGKSFKVGDTSHAHAASTKARGRRRSVVDETDDNGIPWWVTGRVRPSQLNSAEATAARIAEFVQQTRAELRGDTKMPWQETGIDLRTLGNTRWTRKGRDNPTKVAPLPKPRRKLLRKLQRVDTDSSV